MLQENSDLTDRATKLNSYYESLRTNVMSILGQVREPIIPPPPPSGSNIPVSNSTGGMPGVVATSQDQFDSYLNKLQTICSENGDPHKPTYCGTPGPGTDPLATTTPKTALQAYHHPPAKL